MQTICNYPVFSLNIQQLNTVLFMMGLVSSLRVLFSLDLVVCLRFFSRNIHLQWGPLVLLFFPIWSAGGYIFHLLWLDEVWNFSSLNWSPNFFLCPYVTVNFDLLSSESKLYKAFYYNTKIRMPQITSWYFLLIFKPL